MNPTLTIAIPTWGNQKQLSDCLSTLLAYTHFPYQVFIIDNASEADMKENSKDWPDRVKYFDPGENLGWMGGINYALERCDTELFCMMNDDVMFLPGIPAFWQTLARHLSNKEVGIIAPASDFIAGTQALQHITQALYDTTTVMGVCVMMRTEFLKEIGGLDASLPGGDDIDLCIRVAQKGKKIRVEKLAFLHHIGRQSGVRMQGDYYDSVMYKERIYNAITAKHSLKEYLMSSSFSIEPDLRDPKAEDGDHEWLERLHLRMVTLNLGCGTHKIEGAINLDINNSDSDGEGGMQGAGTVAEKVVNAMDLPYMDSSVDMIIASHLLEHLIDPVAALREWKRVLVADGELVVITPDQSEVPSQTMDPTHVHCYNKDSLVSLLDLCGFCCDIALTGAFASLRVMATSKEEVLV